MHRRPITGFGRDDSEDWRSRQRTTSPRCTYDLDKVTVVAQPAESGRRVMALQMTSAAKNIDNPEILYT